MNENAKHYSGLQPNAVTQSGRPGARCRSNRTYQPSLLPNTQLASGCPPKVAVEERTQRVAKPGGIHGSVGFYRGDTIPTSLLNHRITPQRNTTSKAVRSGRAIPNQNSSPVMSLRTISRAPSGVNWGTICGHKGWQRGRGHGRGGI